MRRKVLTLSAIGLLSIGGISAAYMFHPHTPTKIGFHSVQPQKDLPMEVQTHLTSYTKRQTHVSVLPLQQTFKGDVLYIDPSTAYAVAQFHTVWAKLRTKPAVVWVHTTRKQAAKEWQLEGYKTNPLPSSQTLYLASLTPEPNAFHRTKGGWTELPGVLKPTETQYWTRFFNGSH